MAATKPVFRIMAVFLALYFATAANTALSVAIVGGQPAPEVQVLLLVVLGLQDPALPVSAANTILFGLLHNSCKVKFPPQQVAENGTAVIWVPRPSHLAATWK